MRRFTQFRLRSLFAVITIFAVAAAWLGGQLRSRQADLRALAALNANHVFVESASQGAIPCFL